MVQIKNIPIKRDFFICHPYEPDPVRVYSDPVLASI